MQDVDEILAKAPDLVKYNTNFDSEPIKMYYAYGYPRNWKTSSEEEKNFRRDLFNFKDNKNGGASEQIKNAFVNRVKKAILSIGTIENTVIVNMPSSAGPEAIKSRWHEINEVLKSNENRLQVLDSDKIFFSKPRKESYAKNNLADRKADQNVMKDLVINAEQELFGKHVIILDDVITTGNHIRQFGNALREKGASSITCVSLCCTDPQIKHDDTRYRFNIEHDDYCRRNRTNFKDTLDPMEDQELFAKLYYKERPQMQLLEDPLPMKKTEILKKEEKKDPIRIKFISPDKYDPDKFVGQKEESSLAADIKFKQNMAKREDAQGYAQVHTEQKNTVKAEAKAEVKQEATPTKQQVPNKKEIDLPKEIKVAYANISPIINTNGDPVNVNEPRFATTIRLGDLNRLPSTLVTDKNGKEHHIIDFAIVPNKKHVEGKTSPYLVIVKRNDAPAVYAGQEMKFVDKDAVVEFSLNRSQVFGKANSLNLKLDDTIRLHIGKTGAGATGVTLNPAEYKNVDKKSLELSARVNVVNSFDRTIKAMYNMNKIGENKYVDKFIGSAFGYQPKDKETGAPIINQYTNLPITNFNFKLNRDDIRFLPEADKFGNVSIAIVKRDLTPEHLQEKGLHMEEGCNYPINDKGIKQPNYHIIADPKVYKNGEPNLNIVAVIKLNRAELASLPYTTESFTTKEGKQVNNSYIHLTSDRYGNVNVNTKEYEYNNVIANEQKLTSKTTMYSDEINQKERLNWDQTHVRLSPEAFAAKVEMEKTMPNQFDIYRDALKALQPQSKQQEIQQVAQETQNSQKKEYKDYSHTEDEDPLFQGHHTKLAF